MHAAVATEIVTAGVGAVMFSGDSMPFGTVAAPEVQDGGFRKIIEALFIANGVQFRLVGPYVTGSPGMLYPNHFAQPGQSSATALVFNGGITPNVAAAAPNAFTMSWGGNDIVIDGRPTVDILANLQTIRTQAVAAGPAGMRVYMNRLIYTGTFFLSEYNALNAGIIAMCASNGDTFVDIPSTIITGDGFHPVNGPTGYGVVANAYAAKLLAA